MRLKVRLRVGWTRRRIAAEARGIADPVQRLRYLGNGVRFEPGRGTLAVPCQTGIIRKIWDAIKQTIFRR
jgi:hypothetical protein